MFVFTLLKRIFGGEDDQERQPGNQPQRPPLEYSDRQSSLRQSYYVFDRDSKLDNVSRTNVPLTRQANLGQTTNSSRSPYSSQSNSTYVVNREIIDKNSVPAQPPRDNGVKSRSQDAVSGALKSPSVTAKPNLSSVSEKPCKRPDRLDTEGSSSSTGEDPRKGKNPAAGKADEPLSSSLVGKSHPLKPPPLSVKPTISVASSSSLSPQKKNAYIWVEKDASSTYVFPKEIKSLIEKDIVPVVLKMPLSRSSYKDYFHALLYAEDCYLEKWDGFEMKTVKVQLHKAEIYTKQGKDRNFKEDDDKDEKVFVAFELEKLRERRPFLISRDFVYLQPSNKKVKAFQGVIYRVVKSNLVLAEFGDDFYSYHDPEEKYDVKFSFNRVCLKRAHQAIAAASDSLFRNLLFPNVAPKHKLPSAELFAKKYQIQIEAFAVGQILRLQGAPPYLVEGPLVVGKDHLSRTGVVIVDAILSIFRADPWKKILVCAPVNRSCDLLMRGLKKEMPESDMFRANAAFRELDGVPVDILPSCLYEDDMKCFSCPSIKELKKYKVILTTFMSSYRLYGEGIMAGHFSHIFLVDASLATEPEAMVPLANFFTDETIVVVTGSRRNHSGWIRSKIARENGLMTSYFERLCGSGMYKELDPKVMVQLEDRQRS